MRNIWTESGKARITAILALATVGLVAGRFVVMGDDIIPPHIKEAGPERPFTKGQDRKTVFKDVTLSQLQAAPKLFIGLHVKLHVRFNHHESTFAPYYTPFVPEEFFPFSAWEDSKKLWVADDRTKDFPFLYISKHSTELNEVLQASRYENLMLEAKVINDFNGIPWIEVLHLARETGPQWSDDMLHHMILGTEAGNEGHYEVAAAHLTAALDMKMPRDGVAAAEKELGRAMFFLKDYVGSIRHLERAMNLADNDAEIAVLLQASRDQARLAGLSVIEPTRPGEPIRRTVADENMPQSSIVAPPGQAAAPAPAAPDTKELDGLKKKMADMENAMKAKDAQMAEMKKASAAAPAAGGDTKAREAEKKKMQDEMAKMKARQDELEKNLKAKDQAAADATKKAAEMAAKVQELSDAKAKLSADLEKNTKTMAELDKKMKEADPKAMKNLQDQVATLQKERSAMEKDKSKMSDEMKTLQTAQKDLTAKVATLEAEKKALAAKDTSSAMKQMEKSLADKDRQISDLQKELAKWQKAAAVAQPGSAAGAAAAPASPRTGAPQGRRTNAGRVGPDEVQNLPPPPPTPAPAPKTDSSKKGGQSFGGSPLDLVLDESDGEVIFAEDTGSTRGASSPGRRRAEGRVAPGQTSAPISMSR
ncbi:MAG: hypothetical protein HYY93_11545 [Planctomycetes bacterium]|nr:hypothetical protein [Planctomycetota bacterium]